MDAQNNNRKSSPDNLAPTSWRLSQDNLDALLAGRYKARRLLGKGDDGDVWLVERAGDNQLFACKVLHDETEDENQDSTEDLTRVRVETQKSSKEVNIFTKLGTVEGRRHVAQMRDVIRDFPAPSPLQRLYTLCSCPWPWSDLAASNARSNWSGAALIMDYFPVGSVQDLLNAYISHNAAVPTAFIWSVFLDLAEGVHDIHQHDIAHNDICPQNTLLRFDPGQDPRSSYPHAAIADFGWATEMSAQLDDYDMVGWRAEQRNDFGGCTGIIRQLLTTYPWDKAPDADLQRFYDSVSWCQDIENSEAFLRMTRAAERGKIAKDFRPLEPWAYN